MSNARIYKNEFIKIEKDGILSPELIKEIRFFFEWNSLSLSLKNLDRDSYLSFARDNFDNDKVLAGSESEQVRINLYIANRKFIDYLSQCKSEDYFFRRIKLIFNMYNCLAVRILQEKKCLEYIEKLIGKISNEALQTRIVVEFNKLANSIKTNKRSRKRQSAKTSKFIIDRRTIEYLRISNFQIVNVLNTTEYIYELDSSKIGDLEISFYHPQNEMNMLEIVLISVINGIYLPIRKIGLFAN